MEKPLSNLSQVFPQDTTYFYGFPAGKDSGFFNACPPEREELIAMRPVVSAGPDVRIVTFASTVSNEIWRLMEDDLGVPLAKRSQITQLPADIDVSTTGHERNTRVRDALAEMIPNGRLVMAQPHTEERLKEKYLIDPGVTTWLNDKNNIRHLVPEAYRTEEYASVGNGKEFSALDESNFPYPCVVKIGLSAAGDGVRICKSPEDFKAAQEAFKDSDATIIIQKYIDRIDELDIKFVVHQDTTKPFELIGHSGEVALTNGQYLGGIVHNKEQTPELVQNIFRVLEAHILPIIQKKGWFGVGGVDVLIDKDGGFFFNDFNCRMTATMTQTMQINSGLLGKRSLASFIGQFNGDLAEFRTMMSRYARHGGPDHILNVVALAEGKGTVRLQGGVLFDQMDALRDNVAVLRKLGLHSDVFTKIGEK